MLNVAFKEWAVICAALATGKQALIIRKGGIAETDGGLFHPEHSRFWLYPTFVHQQNTGITTEAMSLLEQSQQNIPEPGTLSLTHFAQVHGVYQIHELDSALALADLHIWSESTTRQRFAYRQPGLFVLPVRIYAVPTPTIVPVLPEYDGCKTWVMLDREVTTEQAVSVLDDASFSAVIDAIDSRINPANRV